MLPVHVACDSSLHVLYRTVTCRHPPAGPARLPLEARVPSLTLLRPWKTSLPFALVSIPLSNLVVTDQDSSVRRLHVSLSFVNYVGE